VIVEHGNDVVPEIHGDGEQPPAPVLYSDFASRLLEFRIAREGRCDDVLFQARAELAGLSNLTT
jgi:hypothetical protein